MEYDFSTKEQLAKKLIDYTTNPDDDNIRFKQRIKDKLLQCPELLYVLHNPDYESELFDENGNLMKDGDWSIYFGDNIRPYILFPEVQTTPKNFLCYKVEFNEVPKYNDAEKYCQITFVVFCHAKDIIDRTTGIPRHDLIASILREKFSYSNTFMMRCKPISNKEGITDNDYVTRTLIFESIIPNSIVQTKNDKTEYVNYSPVRK